MFTITKRFYNYIDDCRKISNIQNFFDKVNTNKNIYLLKDKNLVYNIINKRYDLINFDQKISSNVSGKFGESLIEEFLIVKNEMYKKQFSYKNLRPDFITKSEIIEVKTTLRNNKNLENILFSSFKYYNIAKLLNKKIKIYMVGYDEDYFNYMKTSNELFDQHLKNQKNMNIEYVFFHNELYNLLKDD